MASKWQVVDLLNFDGYISSTRGGLEIAGRDVKLEDVAIILLGDKCRWGFGLIAMAEKYEVAVMVCDWRMVPIASMLAWRESSRVGARHIAQAGLTEPRRKNAWKQIVRAKVRNQGRTLEYLELPSFRRLQHLASSVRSGDPENIEAQAARLYWQAMFEADFGRDTDGGDFINGALNYGYTILRGHVIREICAAGLWPTLGIFHRGRSNPFALADDLIEPFRPVVDVVVARLDVSEGLTRQVKASLIAVSERQFQTSGFSVSTSMRQLAQSFAAYVEGDQTKLHVPAWDVLEGG